MGDFTDTEARTDSVGGPPFLFGAGTITDRDDDDTVQNSDQDGGNNSVVGTASIGSITMPVFQAGAVVNIYNPTSMSVIFPNVQPTITPASSFGFCFAAGTAIETRAGGRPVEDLRIGDLVKSHGGRVVPVLWIGRQTIFPRFGPPERLRMVRIARGALGCGLPERDLTVTSDHALLLDGLLVNASALVNGETIEWVPNEALGNSYTVYHVETARHDIIMAEGAPAETFVDYAGRRAFDNYQEFHALYGELRTIPELQIPRVSSKRHLPAPLRAAQAA